MKKILGLLIAVLTLVGCSGGPDKVSKTCSMDTDGMKMSMTATAKSEKANIDLAKYEISVDYDILGFDKKDITDEVKGNIVDKLKQSFASNLDESIEIDTDFGDDKITINYELTKKDLAEAAKARDADLSLKAFVDSFKETKFVCK